MGCVLRNENNKGIKGGGDKQKDVSVSNCRRMFCQICAAPTVCVVL